MRESDIVVWHRKEWLKHSPKAFYYKIEDTLGLGGKKPFDVFILDSGQAFAIEFKLHKKHTAFSLANIKPHQIAGLKRAKQNGAIAVVYIAVRILLDVDTKERLNLRKRRIAMNLEYELRDILELLDKGEKSIDILARLKEDYGQS
jgi:hypothetical protein